MHGLIPRRPNIDNVGTLINESIISVMLGTRQLNMRYMLNFKVNAQHAIYLGRMGVS